MNARFYGHVLAYLLTGSGSGGERWARCRYLMCWLGSPFFYLFRSVIAGGGRGHLSLIETLYVKKKKVLKRTLKSK